jgi:dolichol-phosphate mannosyltransferase
MAATPELEVVIPVFNEGRNIVNCLGALKAAVTTPLRVLICYDRDDDNTLPALADPALAGMDIKPVKNPGRGPHSAVVAGFRASVAPAVLMYPADDDYNAGKVDEMVARFRAGADIVCASRFMPGGGGLEGCPFLKGLIVRVADFLLRHLARLPTHDASNGFRLFSRRVLDEVEIQSSRGFTYSIELLVKAHRRGWPIAEVPVDWFERSDKQSRFKLIRWIPAYLPWFFYAFATTWLGRRA